MFWCTFEEPSYGFICGLLGDVFGRVVRARERVSDRFMWLCCTFSHRRTAWRTVSWRMYPCCSTVSSCHSFPVPGFLQVCVVTTTARESQEREEEIQDTLQDILKKLSVSFGSLCVSVSGEVKALQGRV